MEDRQVEAALRPGLAEGHLGSIASIAPEAAGDAPVYVKGCRQHDLVQGLGLGKTRKGRAAAAVRAAAAERRGPDLRAAARRDAGGAREAARLHEGRLHAEALPQVLS